MTTLSIETLCEQLADPMDRESARVELEQRGLLAAAGMIAWRLRPEEMKSLDFEQTMALDALIGRLGRPAIPILEAFIAQLERPNPSGSPIYTRDGHTPPSYVWALETAAELRTQMRRAGRPSTPQPDFRKTCPICAGTRLGVDMEGSDKEGMNKVRMFHDRTCKECDASWTPGSPKWGAWLCIVVGMAFLAIVAGTAYALLFQNAFPLGFGAMKAHVQNHPDEAQLVGLIGGFLGLPGLGALVYGLRALLGRGQDVTIRQWSRRAAR